MLRSIPAGEEVSAHAVVVFESKPMTTKRLSTHSTFEATFEMATMSIVCGIRPRSLKPLAASKGEFCRDKVALTSQKSNVKGRTFKATFLGKDGQKTTCEIGQDEYILVSAEEQGLDLPCTCRGGICGACVGRVVEGSVDMSDVPDVTFTLSEEEIEDGMALLCMARPESDVVIETQCDWGYSLGVAEWKGASGTLSASPEPLMGDKWEKS